MRGTNRAPDGWESDNSLYGKTSNVTCPSCTLCGKPMLYMFGTAGVFKMHLDTGQFLCGDEPPITEAVE